MAPPMAPTEPETVAASNVTDKVTDLEAARRNKKAQSAASPKSDHSDGKSNNRRFDRAKVERIKAEIKNGTYEINPSRIADKFIEHERN